MKILKNIKNMLSPSAKAEFKVLESWREEYIQQLENMENSAMNESFKSKWLDYKDYRPDTAWQKFEKRLNKKQGLEKNKRIGVSRYLSVAAVFVLVLGIWWLISTSGTSEQPLKFHAGNTVMKTELEDKSLVVLDTFSKLEQTAYRHVRLSGRAYFDVTKDSENQFIITTPEATVTVLGTAFNVTSRNGKTRVDVVEGLVKISFDNQFLLCAAGQSAEVYNGKINLLKEEKNISSDWKNNVLVFDNVHIEDVIKTIAHHYQLDLRLENKATGKDCYIKTKFVNAGIQAVLKEISMIARFEYTLQQHVLTVTRMGC